MKKLLLLLPLLGCATAESIQRRCAADYSPYSSVAECNQTLLFEEERAEKRIADGLAQGITNASNDYSRQTQQQMFLQQQRQNMLDAARVSRQVNCYSYGYHNQFTTCD